MQELLTAGLTRGFIEKNPALEPGQDYALLRKEGLAHIEKLAHRIWTDYNVHDPGITILDLLCYAITDLGYRAAYPVRDLLTENDRGVPVNRANFHTARQALTSGPVTFDDLRKLLVDIAGVRNAWIQPHTDVQYRVDEQRRLLNELSPATAAPTAPRLVVVNGLYDVFIEYEDEVGFDPDTGQVGLSQKGTAGEFVDPAGRGLVFHAARPLVLEAVTVYPESAGSVTVRLLNKQGDVLKSITAPATKAGHANRLPLNLAIEPGSDYQLEASGSSVKLFETRGPTAAYPYSLRDVVYVAGATRPTPAEPASRYPVFYQWELKFPPPRASAERTGAIAGPADNTGGSPIVPQDKGIGFTVLRDLVLESVDVYPAEDGTVTIRLLDVAGERVVNGSGQPVQRAGLEVTAGKGAVTVELGFELSGGRSYRLDAKGSGVRLWRTREAEFPYEAPNALRLERGFPSASTLYFFYRWNVSYPTPPGSPALTRHDVRLRVRDRLFHERNLCEDVVQICELDKEEIALCADIEVRPSADLDAVLAEIFYRLESHVAPPVRFYTLQEMLAKGRPVDEIFEGPRLTHGFIDDQEFRTIARRCELRVSDIVNLLMEAGLPDLVAIRNIRLLSFVNDTLRREDPWILPLATDRFRSPSFSAARSKVVFYKNDLPYYANRGRQDVLLKKKRASIGRTPLRAGEGDLPIPVGEFRAPEAYYPAQNDLPPAYHVGQIRVPESAPALRKAQSRQLKAYLLFFEQLLADYLAQLAHVRELFSWQAGSIRSYFRQAIAGIADLDDLYIQGRIAEVATSHDPARAAVEPHLPLALEHLAETERSAAERRGRFLDHLLARFSEEFTEYSLLMYSVDRARTRANEDKRRFLADYPVSSGARAESYDYRFPDWSANLSGYQHRVYRLLGIRELTRRRLACNQIEIVEVAASGGYRFVVNGEDGRLFESIVCQSRASIEMLLDYALGIGGDESHYRKGTNAAGTTVWTLVRRCSDTAHDEAIGETASDGNETLEAVRTCLATCGASEGFHAIEHVLLRPRTKGRAGNQTPFLPIHVNRPGDCDCPDVRDPYSFRLTVLLPAWSRRFRDARFRRLAEETLRREAPAHVYVKICWLSHEQMRQVDMAYEEWATRLAALEAAFGTCAAGARAADRRGGSVPLPEARQADTGYLSALEHLIAVLRTLVTVHPVARLHDCRDTSGDEPQVSLNNTNLGTLDAGRLQ